VGGGGSIEPVEPPLATGMCCSIVYWAVRRQPRELH